MLFMKAIGSRCNSHAKRILNVPRGKRHGLLILP